MISRKKKSAAAFAIGGVALAIIVMVALQTSLFARSSTAPTGSGFEGTNVPFEPVVNEGTTFFLIGYPLVNQPETDQQVSINDYPWLASIVENGETIVSLEQAKEFDSISGDRGFFAILMEDGTTKYLDIDLYKVDLIPNIPYVKAEWIAADDFGDKAFAHVSENAYPILQKAINDKSRWVALENPADDETLKTLFEETKVKNFEVEKADGKVDRYQLRYIDSTHTAVS